MRTSRIIRGDRRVLRKWTTMGILSIITGGCGGGGGSGVGAVTEYYVGGGVSGLAQGKQLVLLNDGADAVTVNASDGGFRFPRLFKSGDRYDATIGAQPDGQTCVISNGSGSVTSANVKSISVTCTTDGFAIGGMVSGLAGSQRVTLKLNSTETTTVAADGAFTFNTRIPSGGNYSVTVDAQPNDQFCDVANGSGTMADDVNNVTVTCGSKLRVLHAFTGGIDGAAPQSRLVRDSAGNLYGTTSSGDHANVSGDYAGTVFKLSPTTDGGWAESVLYTFTSADSEHGAYPLAGLIMDSAGKLYGTTSEGGSENAGAVFMLAPDAGGHYTLSILYSFNSAGNGNPTHDGLYPHAGVVMDAAGNLYGTTWSGGTDLYGVVYKLSPVAGGGYIETVLHNFNGSTDDGGQPGGLLVDGAGNLYGTTLTGGSAYSGTVFRLSPGASGYTETLLSTFSEPGDGGSPMGDLIMDNAGSLYGTTSTGGKSGHGTVFRLTRNQAGDYDETNLYSFDALYNAATPYAGLVADNHGNLFGTTIGGSGNSGLQHGTIFELSPAANGDYSESLLYSFLGDSDGAGPGATLVMDSAGNLYGTAGGGPTGRGTVFELRLH